MSNDRRRRPVGGPSAVPPERGYQPEGPAEPGTPPPGTAGASSANRDRPGAVAPGDAEIRADLETWMRFLRDVYEAEGGTPYANRSLGYAYGYASAMLDAGRPQDAIWRLGWIIAEARRFADRPGFPATAASAS